LIDSLIILLGIVMPNAEYCLLSFIDKSIKSLSVNRIYFLAITVYN